MSSLLSGVQSSRKLRYSGEWNFCSSSRYALRGLCSTALISGPTRSARACCSSDAHIDLHVLVQPVANDQVVRHVQAYGLHGVPRAVVREAYVACVRGSGEPCSACMCVHVRARERVRVRVCGQLMCLGCVLS